jgi:hypothetical protein
MQQSPMVFLPDPAETGLDILHFAAGHHGIGGPHGGLAGLGTGSLHQMDGGVAHLGMAAIAGPAEGPHGQPVFTPAMPPVGKRGISEAELFGCVLVPKPKLASPLVECNCAAADGALLLTPLSLSRPAALGRLCCGMNHGLFSLTLLYRAGFLPRCW